MLFLMALVTEQFKVAPVKGDRRIADVCGCDVLPVMDDVSRAATAFADTMLKEEVPVAAFAPRFALIKPCCKLFRCNHPLSGREKDTCCKKQMPFKKLFHIL